MGGHCISVDPYYLTYKAQEVGYKTKVVLSGREINDGMSRWLVDKIILEAVKKGLTPKGCSILIMGVTFKENCPDIRNSKVIEIINALKIYGFNIKIFDPLADNNIVTELCNIGLTNDIKNELFEIVFISIGHNEFRKLEISFWDKFIKNNSLIFDVKGILPRSINAIRL